MTNATYALPVEGSGSAVTGATITVTLERDAPHRRFPHPRQPKLC